MVFKELCTLLQEAGIQTESLFLNANAGFDAEVFRKLGAEMKMEANIAVNPSNNAVQDEYLYFDEKLFKRRITIERANAWLDRFKAWLMCFETIALHWFMRLLLVFSVLFIRKINEKLKL